MASISQVNFWATLLFLGSSMSAIAAPRLPHQPPSTVPFAPILLAQTQTTASPLPSLVQGIQRDLAQRLNVAPASIQILATTPVTWPDQCLGLARPNQRCRGGELPGWRIELASAQQYWTYRSDRSGKQFRLEPLAGADGFAQGELTPAASQTLLKTVAQNVKRPINKLKILELQATTWDGCLGIFAPDRACTMIAIFGFRALITDGNATWVYHLNEDASQIAQNATASGAHGKVLVSLMPVETEPVPNPNFDSKRYFAASSAAIFPAPSASPHC
ncbi:MAG: hypothetical protein HC824_08930 [Synechococcales cyanobacterium RM1_1_8]|nr:hypothetical protein [Synechococcales cyanobacterium RM1_1_8]